MNDETRRRLRERFRYVSEAVDVLARKRDELSLSDYRRGREHRDVVEREFQTAIEACIDIGELVLRANGIDRPEANADVFRALRREGVLSEESTADMTDAAGFRNVLTHRYGHTIDDEQVWNSLQNDLPVFRQYLAEIRDEIDASWE